MSAFTRYTRPLLSLAGGGNGSIAADVNWLLSANCSLSWVTAMDVSGWPRERTQTTSEHWMDDSSEMKETGVSPDSGSLSTRRSVKLDDPNLDSSVPEARDAWLADALRQQIAFMRAAVPFWRERLLLAAIDEREIVTLADLANVPILTKEELRATSPAALLPIEARLELKINRWTSGTFGRPTVNFWSEKDWAALVASTARMVGRQAPMRAPTVFSAYSQAHVTGPLYNAPWSVPVETATLSKASDIEPSPDCSSAVKSPAEARSAVANRKSICVG